MGKELGLADLGDKNLSALQQIAKALDVSNYRSFRKNDLVFKILETQAQNNGLLFRRGALDVIEDGKGFLRVNGYLPSNEDVYVGQSQIKRFNLRTGDMISGHVRPPKDIERYFSLLKILAVNAEEPDSARNRRTFESLTPLFPNERLRLEVGPDGYENTTARIMDFIVPIGKGQRGLIVSPPKAGKTTVLKTIANSVVTNHAECVVIVLLVDERPEEVTDFRRSVDAEVVASTFDEPPDSHLKVAELVLAKAKRAAEQGKDVVILLDSLTRLTRAANIVVESSGKTLQGGLDPAAMNRPKRFFGAARNIEEGGSLTIVATALIDTGSRMDDHIYEEFKGTGNMEMHLDRGLQERRIFPAIDIKRSGTRHEEEILKPEELAGMVKLRRAMAAIDNTVAAERLVEQMQKTKTNTDFLALIERQWR